MINAVEQDTFIGLAAVSKESLNLLGEIQGRDQAELPGGARRSEGLERHGGHLQVHLRRVKGQPQRAPYFVN